MSQQSLSEIIARAVADYGFRLAVIWGTDQITEGFCLSPSQTEILTELIVPELKKLPNPVEPEDQAAVRKRLVGLLS